jgi:hypothetical protein
MSFLKAGGGSIPDAIHQLFDLGPGQRIEHQSAHQCDVFSTTEHLLVPLVGEGGEGAAAVGRVGAAVDVALAARGPR